MLLEIPALSEYVLRAHPLPIWKPSDSSTANTAHFDSLAIPKIGGIPSLLLHDLDKQISNEQKKRIDQVFNIAVVIMLVYLLMLWSANLIILHSFICNTSGSGKTRLTFEGLARIWGVYFSARTKPDLI